MAASWIILLGGNELNAGVPGVAAAIGARLLVVDWNETPPIRGDRHLRLDIKDSKAVLDALRPMLGQVLFAYTAADVATETVACINAAAGHIRADVEALRRARDKLAMNEAWAAAGLLSKRFRHCRSSEDIAAFMTEIGDDVIVKPEGASSSRGISVLRYADRGSIDFSGMWERAAHWDKGRGVLVEEFVRGTEFTVEMVGDAYGNVDVWGISKKYHTPITTLNRIATKLHYNPSDVPRATLEALARFSAECYRALGLRASMGHFEVLVDGHGRMIPVEMAARSSGFIASHLLDALTHTTGGFFSAYADVLRGGSVRDGFRSSRQSSMYFFYDPPPGLWTIDGIAITDFLPSGIRSLASDRSRLRSGERILPIDCDNDRFGYEVLVGLATDLTIDQIITAERSLYDKAVVPESGAACQQVTAGGLARSVPPANSLSGTL